MSKMLLSIKPQYAQAILEGKKKFEFRKTCCRPGTATIVFYVSSPQQKVIGEAKIAGIIEDKPAAVWKKTKTAAGISKKFFDAYYAGKDIAVAYHLENVKTYKKPRTLLAYGIKRAPQSYVYIKSTTGHN